MTTSEIEHAVELILAATFKERRDGCMEQFLFGELGAPLWARNRVASLCHDRAGLLKAVLHVRTHGPLYLRSLSVSEIQSKLIRFLEDHYALLAEETWMRRFEGSFADTVSAGTKAKLARALAASEIFAPRSVVTLFPLVPVRVKADFDSEPFFLVKPAELSATRLRQAFHPADLLPDQFPPFVNWQGTRNTPGAWLGVRSPTLSASRKMRNAVLGAVALLPHPHERHEFTGRAMFGGYATVDTGWTVSLGEPHTPALSEDIVVDADDHRWLSLLAGKLNDSTSAVQKQIKALEYYYRAWPTDEVERFPILFMALDAIFGDASQATQALVDAVGPLMGSAYDNARLKLLLGLRASVVHGGAPDVYEASKYFAYYERYHTDPIYDLELITARCLQAVVFEGKLAVRPHTHAALIKERLGIDV
jgi:hypothetical protein